MKESEFIRQNREKWDSFEKDLKKGNIPPPKLSAYYIDILDDLSFARTHYPNRQVRHYLNGLVQLLSLRIYKGQKSRWSGILKFWRKDLPLVMYHSRQTLLFAFLVFGFFVGAGIFAQTQDPEFCRSILGDRYVDETLNSIAEGDPMRVYKTSGEVEMFLGITFNNLLVSVRAYLLGLLAGVGTFAIAMINGVMLGSFQTFFFQQDVGWESVLTIWQHGTIEIFSIVLATMAGFTLAKGILFPGTYSRLDAFRIQGRKSLMIMLGIMPLLVFSGFIEGFITRYTDVPAILLASTILLSLSFVLAYFVWYPKRVFKKYPEADDLPFYLQPIRATRFTKKEKLSPFIILGESFRRLGMQRIHLFIHFGVYALGITAIMFFVPSVLGLGTADHPSEFVTFLDVFNFEAKVSKYLVNIIMFFGSYWMFSRFMAGLVQDEDKLKPRFKNFLQHQAFPALLFSVFGAAFLFSWISSLFLIWYIPLTGIWLAFSMDQSKPIFKAYSGFQTVYTSGIGSVLWMGFLISITGFFVLSLFQSLVFPLSEFLSEYLVPIQGFDTSRAIKWFTALTFNLLFLLVFYMLLLSSGLYYYSLLEKAFAGNLRTEIHRVFPSLQRSTKAKATILGEKRLKPS